jgi:diphthamide biosynthesis protein 7
VALLVAEYVRERFALIESPELLGVSFEGPQGAGKSAALFLLVSAWRALRHRGVRVTYVEDAAEWVQSHRLAPFEFLLCELLYTFLGEAISFFALLRFSRAREMRTQIAMLRCEALRRAELELPCDSVEFLPRVACGAAAWTPLLACGNYLLEDGAAQRKRGRVVLFEWGSDLRECARRDGPAVYDLRWARAPWPAAAGPLLCAAGADGSVELLALRRGEGEGEGEGEGKALCSLDLHQRVALAEAAGALSVDVTGEGRVAAGATTGHACVWERGADGALRAGPTWRAHELETWVAAWATHERDVLYTGADDAALKAWDLRAGVAQPAVAVLRQHGAGVCSVAPSPHEPHTLATGSYDERLRLWDARKLAAPRETLALGGGVWRLRWHPDPERASLLLVACMTAGVAVVDAAAAAAPRECARFGGHDEHLAYGCDWAGAAAASGVAASCSFYNRMLCLWRVAAPEGAK